MLKHCWLLTVSLFCTVLVHGSADTPLFTTLELSGWRLVSDTPAEPKALVIAKPDGVLSFTGTPVGYLVTKESYSNYRLTLEWRWPAAKGNGGVLVHIEGPDKVDRVWPRCLQFQTKVGNVGDLLPMAGFVQSESLAKDAKALPHRAADSEKPLGEWNQAEIICRGDIVECRVNGVLQNTVKACVPSQGRVGIQLEGTPFELRNVILTPLD